jgi:NTP pyrophosphatase (non-canonical NTP hydrolase)
MRLNEYQDATERTAGRGPGDTTERRYLNFALGLAGEAGEVAEIIKKAIFHSHKIDQIRLLDELGDCLWYIATMASTAGFTLREVAEYNIHKLQARYPEGFSVERSLERVDRT